MREGPIIRDATPRDAVAIAEVQRQSLAAGRPGTPGAARTTSQIGRQIRLFTSQETYLVLENSKRVLGWGLVRRYSDRSGYRFCSESSICVRPSLRGQGYASRLERAVLDRCRLYGYHHVLARCFADDAAALEFHRRFGYHVVGTQREICFRDGRWRDVVILQRVD